MLNEQSILEIFITRITYIFHGFLLNFSFFQSRLCRYDMNDNKRNCIVKISILNLSLQEINLKPEPKTSSMLPGIKIIYTFKGFLMQYVRYEFYPELCNDKFTKKRVSRKKLPLKSGDTELSKNASWQSLAIWLLLHHAMFTARKRSWGKVMFLQLSVHRGGGLPPRGSA